MRLTLHVGHPKTGTTALQSVLSGNSMLLLKNASVLYPTVSPSVDAKHALAIPWLLGIDNKAIERRARCKGAVLKNLSKRYWQSLCDEINSHAPEHLILSAEGFWMLPAAAGDRARFFRQSICRLASHVRIVGYLRSPVSYCASKLNQKLRNFRTYSMPSTNYYRDSIEAWEAMGFDQYDWQIYDRSKLINGDIIDDFCGRFLPPDLDQHLLQRRNVEKSNESVSNEALVIFEELTIRYPILRENIFDPRRSKIVRILRTADSTAGGRRRPSVTAEARMAIIQRCDDLAWLEERGLFFPDINPSEISRGKFTEACQTFSQVSDFCSIDLERLARLRAAVSQPIRDMFHPRTAGFLSTLCRLGRSSTAAL